MARSRGRSEGVQRIRALEACHQPPSHSRRLNTTDCFTVCNHGRVQEHKHRDCQLSADELSLQFPISLAFGATPSGMPDVRIQLLQFQWGLTDVRSAPGRLCHSAQHYSHGPGQPSIGDNAPSCSAAAATAGTSIASPATTITLDAPHPCRHRSRCADQQQQQRHPPPPRPQPALLNRYLSAAGAVLLFSVLHADAARAVGPTLLLPGLAVATAEVATALALAATKGGSPAASGRDVMNPEHSGAATEALTSVSPPCAARAAARTGATGRAGRRLRLPARLRRRLGGLASGAGRLGSPLADVMQRVMVPSALLTLAGRAWRAVHSSSAALAEAVVDLLAVGLSYSCLAREVQLGRLPPGQSQEMAWRRLHKAAAQRVAHHLSDLPPTPPLAPALTALGRVSIAAGLALDGVPLCGAADTLAAGAAAVTAAAAAAAAAGSASWGASGGGRSATGCGRQLAVSVSYCHTARRREAAVKEGPSNAAGDCQSTAEQPVAAVETPAAAASAPGAVCRSEANRGSVDTRSNTCSCSTNTVASEATTGMAAATSVPHSPPTGRLGAAASTSPTDPPGRSTTAGAVLPAHSGSHEHGPTSTATGQPSTAPDASHGPPPSQIHRPRCLGSVAPAAKPRATAPTSLPLTGRGSQPQPRDASPSAAERGLSHAASASSLKTPTTRLSTPGADAAEAGSAPPPPPAVSVHALARAASNRNTMTAAEVSSPQPGSSEASQVPSADGDASNAAMQPTSHPRPMPSLPTSSLSIGAAAASSQAEAMGGPICTEEVIAAPGITPCVPSGAAPAPCPPRYLSGPSALTPEAIHPGISRRVNKWFWAAIGLGATYCLRAWVRPTGDGPPGPAAPGPTTSSPPAANHSASNSSQQSTSHPGVNGDEDRHSGRQQLLRSRAFMTRGSPGTLELRNLSRAEAMQLLRQEQAEVEALGLPLYGRADHVHLTDLDRPAGLWDRLDLTCRGVYLLAVFLPFLTLGIVLLLVAGLVNNNLLNTSSPCPAHGSEHHIITSGGNRLGECAPTANSSGWRGAAALRCRRAAWRLLLVGCRRSGAAFIKWGQWAATRVDLFPDDFCEALSELHDRAPTHSFRFTRRQVERSFGVPLEELFEAFDPRPVASGSIAQVHKALMRCSDGSPLDVAVKVVHPRVERRIRQDFALLRPAAAALHRLLPSLRPLNLPDTVAQFSCSMTAQADLRVEAAHLRRFYVNFARVAGQVTTPRPLPGLVRTEVMVETWEAGRSVAAFMTRGSPDGGSDPRVAGPPSTNPLNTAVVCLGVDTYLKMLLQDNFVHTDLHPGNIMVRLVDSQGRPMPLPGDLNGANHGSSAAAGHTRRCTASGSSSSSAGSCSSSSAASCGGSTNSTSRGRRGGGGVTQVAKTCAAAGGAVQLVLLDFGLAEELTPAVRHHFISFLQHLMRGDGAAAASHLLRWTSRTQGCPDPAALTADMVALTATRCNIHSAAGIDLDAAMKDVLRLARKHGVTIDSCYASLVIAVCVIVGFATSLDPWVNLVDAAVPALLAHALTGRVVGRLYS